MGSSPTSFLICFFPESLVSFNISIKGPHAPTGENIHELLCYYWFIFTLNFRLFSPSVNTRNSVTYNDWRTRLGNTTHDVTLLVTPAVVVSIPVL